MDPVFHHEATTAYHSDSYLLPAVFRFLRSYPAPRRVFDLGCGNGAAAHAIAARGYDVTGVDPSPDGIEIGRAAFPGPRLEVGSAYDDLAATYGVFDVVVSLEVVEHLMSPKRYAETLRDLIAPGGVAIVSTPYHGYLKNVAVAALGKWDHHHNPLWEGGHVKFWSRPKLQILFERVGLKEVGFKRVGRIPPLAKSMIAVFAKAAT